MGTKALPTRYWPEGDSTPKVRVGMLAINFTSVTRRVIERVVLCGRGFSRARLRSS